MPNSPKWRSWFPGVARGLIVLGLLTAWEIASRHNRTNMFFFSSPIKIATRIGTWLAEGEIYRHSMLTLWETMLGFGLGVVGGLALALLCYYVPVFDQLFHPFAEIANGMPRAVFGPLFILWFGLGVTSKAVLAASLVLFIVFFATLTGLHEVDQALIDKVRLMGANRKDLLLHVLLPSALSWVFSSLRSSVGFALAGAVIGEYIGASKGLGFLIALSEGNLDAAGVFAGLTILSVIVLGMNAILKCVERFLRPWQPSER